MATAGAMIDVKNGKLSFQVGDEKVEFNLRQSMARLTIDDSCCRVDILESTLNQEVKTCHLVEGSLEAALIGYHVTGSHLVEKEEYARLLNQSTIYAHRQSPIEVLSVAELPSKEEEKSAPKVELKSLRSHLRYEFLDPDHELSVVVSSNRQPLIRKIVECS